MGPDVEYPKTDARLDGAASAVERRVGHALGEAVAAIYFADRSDYLGALWIVVRDLGGEEAVSLLESDDHAAYHKYAADRAVAVPNV